MYKNEKDEDMKNQRIKTIIDTFLSSNKFQTQLTSTIVANLSNRKVVSLPRNKITEKICVSNFIKETENEILECLYKTFSIDHKVSRNIEAGSKKKIENHASVSSLNNLNNNNSLNGSLLNNSNSNVFSKKDSIYVKESILDNDCLKSGNLGEDNIDSPNLLNILVEEFISCDDPVKLENYFGDFSNFDLNLIANHTRMEDILEKTSNFLKNLRLNSDSYMIPNVINFFNKISKCCDVFLIVNFLNIFIRYFKDLVEKFYKSTFDITKFYKLSFNVECLNTMMMKFYNNKEIILRKLEPSKIEYLIETLLSCILLNYDKTNTIYSKEKENMNSEFGISTNYIILLFFLLDQDFCVFKIMFRNSSFRKTIIKNFKKWAYLPFIDVSLCNEDFNKKNCFLWKHHSILSQIFPNKKITKKYLIFSWLSIKLHFLGLVVRYYPIKEAFMSLGKREGSHLRGNYRFDCFSIFKSTLSYCINLMTIESNDELYDFEAQEKEFLFYLIKEISCDLILYCLDEQCVRKKNNLVAELLYETKINQEQKLVWFFDDLALAFKENILN